MLKHPAERALSSLIFSAALLWAGAAWAAEVQVYAAASLSDALTEIGKAHEAKTGDKPVFNFAASNLLARQIQEGAPADIFFSADEEKMDSLEGKGLLSPGTRRSLLSNTLVIVAASDSTLTMVSPKELAEPHFKRIALAEPRSVPAGIYAQEYLKSIGIWEKVLDRLIPTENVRAALAAVEYGDVDAGIVYRTDASISKKVRVIHEVPLSEGPQISYPVAAVKGSKSQEAALRFLEHLESGEGMDICRKYGFIVTRTPE